MSISKWLVLAVLSGFPLAALPAASVANVLVFGDSLSAGYGLPQGTGWVSLLERRIAQAAPNYKVVNASISGETAAGGTRRIAGALAQHKPAVVILELGANDGLRGQRIETLQADLETVVRASQQQGAKVLLVGMRLPPNYGTDYVRRFEDAFKTVARKYNVAFAPFLLDGFGERYELFQADGIHPTREAQPLMLETIWKKLEPLLTPARSAPGRR
jgi:acyl-CoA thioesterase-1